jgi:hypothetical protein
MTETEDVARAIYEGRNGRGCTPWSRLPAAHKGPYLADAMAAIRVIIEGQYPGRSGQPSADNPQWTPDEIKRFEKDGSRPAVLTRLPPYAKRAGSPDKGAAG